MGCRKGKDDCRPKDATVACEKCGALAAKKSAVCKPKALKQTKSAKAKTDGADDTGGGAAGVNACKAKKKHEACEREQKHAKHDKEKKHKAKSPATELQEPPAEAFGAEGVLLQAMHDAQKKPKRKHTNGGEKR